MSLNKPTTPKQNPKDFIDKITANTSILHAYNNNGNNILNISKKKFSLDHSNGSQKEPFSTKNLNYFISPRSSSEQIFKNIKNMALLSKNNTVVSPKPLLNNSNSINKEYIANISHDNKENIFSKYINKDNSHINKTNNKLLHSSEKNTVIDDQKRDKNTAEIIESLESLKNKYKTLKEMNFLKNNKNIESNEMICSSKFSDYNCRFRNHINENNVNGTLQNYENSTNNTINENSKKSQETKKNYSGNMSNILSTNSNSESEIHQKSNEKEQKNIKKKSNQLLTDVFNKNMAAYTLNKDKIMKIFESLTKKHGNQQMNPVFSRNLSIPENNLQIFEGKKSFCRRNSLHSESEKNKNQNIIPDQLRNILKKTKKIMNNYKIKEISWVNEKKELHVQIDVLKKRLSQYEIV